MALSRKELESQLSQKASGPNCVLPNTIPNTTCWWNNDTIYDSLLFGPVTSCINDLLTICNDIYKWTMNTVAAYHAWI